MSAAVPAGSRLEPRGLSPDPDAKATANHFGDSTTASPKSGSGEGSSVIRVDPASETEKSKNPTDPELSEEQQRQVDELRRRDAEVRAHEQAHAAAGGPYASA
ncbi:MAG: putative metalloprotease CJM1_0395 family protein, partial [Methyloligellaceae bacterium]